MPEAGAQADAAGQGDADQDGPDALGSDAGGVEPSTEAETTTESAIEPAADALIDVYAEAADSTSKAEAAVEAQAEVADAAPDATAGAESDGAIACANSDAGLGGIGVPPGTIASASGGTVAGDAIDGTAATAWNATGYVGWIEVYFPSSIAIDGIQLIVGGLATEVYTLTGFVGGVSTALGSWTYPVNAWGSMQTLPRMRFASGAYDAIRIDVQGGNSWVQVNEISILTPNCP